MMSTMLGRVFALSNGWSNRKQIIDAIEIDMSSRTLQKLKAAVGRGLQGSCVCPNNGIYHLR